MKKTLIVKLREITSKHPELSSILCLGRALKGEKISEEKIMRFISRFIHKSDLNGESPEILLKHFAYLSKPKKTVSKNPYYKPHSKSQKTQICS